MQKVRAGVASFPTDAFYNNTHFDIQNIDANIEQSTKWNIPWIEGSKPSFYVRNLSRFLMLFSHYFPYCCNDTILFILQTDFNEKFDFLTPASPHSMGTRKIRAGLFSMLKLREKLYFGNFIAPCGILNGIFWAEFDGFARKVLKRRSEKRALRAATFSAVNRSKNPDFPEKTIGNYYWKDLV